MIHRFYVLCYCQKFNRTDDVTSAGVIPGIMSVTDRSGATPDADNFLQTNNKDTQRRVRHPLLCFGITWVDLK